MTCYLSAFMLSNICLPPPSLTSEQQLIMLIFSEALALYGLIVALIVSQHSYTCGSDEF